MGQLRSSAPVQALGRDRSLSLLQLKLFPLTTANAQMPGPRNSKRQKKLKALKGKKRKGTPECRAEDEPVATTAVDGDATPADPAPRAEEEEEEGLLREPPIYDPGTGPRVRSMDEFLRSSFASEPTWDDELCAEFAQEEMLEMLRTVLPQEMALVSAAANTAEWGQR